MLDFIFAIYYNNSEDKFILAVDTSAELGGACGGAVKG